MRLDFKILHPGVCAVYATGGCRERRFGTIYLAYDYQFNRDAWWFVETGSTLYRVIDRMPERHGTLVEAMTALRKKHDTGDTPLELMSKSQDADVDFAKTVIAAAQGSKPMSTLATLAPPNYKAMVDNAFGVRKPQPYEYDPTDDTGDVP
jgi:hypothetical protein